MKKPQKLKLSKKIVSQLNSEQSIRIKGGATQAIDGCPPNTGASDCYMTCAHDECPTDWTYCGCGLTDGNPCQT